MFVCVQVRACVVLFGHDRRACVFLTEPVFFFVSQQKNQKANQSKSSLISFSSLLQVLLHMACDSTEGRSSLPHSKHVTSSGEM